MALSSTQQDVKLASLKWISWATPLAQLVSTPVSSSPREESTAPVRWPHHLLSPLCLQVRWDLSVSTPGAGRWQFHMDWFLSANIRSSQNGFVRSYEVGPSSAACSHLHHARCIKPRCWSWVLEQFINGQCKPFFFFSKKLSPTVLLIVNCWLLQLQLFNFISTITDNILVRK